MPSLVQLREEMIAKSEELARIRAEAGPDLDMDLITSIQGDSHYKVAELQRRMTEINELGRELDTVQAAATIGQLNEVTLKGLTEPKTTLPLGAGGAGGRWTYGRQPTKSLGEVLTEHKGFKAFREGNSPGLELHIPELSIKTLITLADIGPQAQRDPLVPMALEERTVGDLMAQSTTNANTIEYYEETTVTNNAANVTEGDAKPESALDWTLRTENVRKIGTWIPATRESLDDVPQLEGEIRNRLGFMVLRREEAQLLAGDGNAPNLRGLLNRVGIQTQAKGADPTPDAIYRAMQKVRGASGAGFAEPTAVVLHPNDWTDVKLLRTADGIYIWGNPSEEGPDRIWGKLVRQTTAMTEGTGLTGAFRPFAEVVRRTGITITMSSEHSTYFTENKVAILAEERLALKCTRPSAFATVTGI
jgi:HK97 family phage major capsid protein